jgi:hypothetical protein
MTGVAISLDHEACYGVAAEQCVQSREYQSGRSFQFLVPPLVRGIYFHGAVLLQPHSADTAERIPDRNPPRDLQLALRHRTMPEQFREGARDDSVKRIHDLFGGWGIGDVPI